MKIAVPLVNGQVAAHFGHCEQFALFEVDEQAKQVVGRELRTPPPHEPGVLPRWLHEQGADVIIAGGMGSRAQMLFSQNKIQVVLGAVNAAADQLIADFLAGKLAAGDNLCDSEGRGCGH